MKTLADIEHKERTVAGHLAYWRVNRQDVLKCCFLIREDCQAGTAAQQREIQVQSQRKPDPFKMLDRALSVLKHLPEEKGSQDVIERYAFGLIHHRPPRVVGMFWKKVPEQAVIDMAPLTAALLL